MHWTRRKGNVFEGIGHAALALALVCICGCPPALSGSDDEQPAGTYLASRNKLYGDDEGFDVRSTVIYPAQSREGLQNPGIGVTDRELTMYRCTWCHECGFEAAWDWEHYGSTAWEPHYTGEEWGPVVQRMMAKENSMLQEEQIARRIYGYLHDASLGAYDVMADDQGAVVAELDAPPAVEAKEGTAQEEDQ